MNGDIIALVRELGSLGLLAVTLLWIMKVLTLEIRKLRTVITVLAQAMLRELRRQGDDSLIIEQLEAELAKSNKD